MKMTHNWLDRGITHFNNTKPKYGYTQSLFPIVQGSTYRDLRIKSAEYITSCQAEGNAIGGLSVGEPHEVMYELTDLVCHILPEDKPRYLMGVGTPANILESIALGVDMFDCVMPTRSGRHGQAFTWAGRINLRNAGFADDPRPLDAASSCPAARDYSRAYLHHLVKSREYLAPMLLSWANVHFYQELMAAMRAAIGEGRFEPFAQETLARLEANAGGG